MSNYSTPLPLVLVHQRQPAPLPEPVEAWILGLGLAAERVRSHDDLVLQLLRARPAAVVVDARGDDAAAAALKACAAVKRDAYTAVIPLAVVTSENGASLEAAMAAGADEVIDACGPEADSIARLRGMIARSERDITVHPSTRLPGAPAIEAAIEARLGTPFAVCYADLDHFKEFNDRYSYTEGDRVIRILATLLHDVVRGICPRDGFVGHVGGDDFIFVIPRARVDEVCSAVVQAFDELMPLQYSEHDRRAGYFFGKDRRGQLHRVPLMTLSIGVVTNERRSFASAAAVSALATEMKTYAKTLPGSVYAVDRRTDDRTEATLMTPRERTGTHT